MATRNPPAPDWIVKFATRYHRLDRDAEVEGVLDRAYHLWLTRAGDDPETVAQEKHDADRRLRRLIG